MTETDAEAEFQTAARQEVDGDALFGDSQRMVQGNEEHVRPEPARWRSSA